MKQKHVQQREERSCCPTWPFFLEVKRESPRRGDFWGSLFSRATLLLSHASHLTGKCLCKSAVPVSWMQGEVSVQSGAGQLRCVCVCGEKGFLLACSILPPQIPHCPRANKSFFVMKMYPGDTYYHAHKAGEDTGTPWACVYKSVSVCSLSCPCCITKEWVTHIPSSFCLRKQLSSRSPSFCMCVRACACASFFIHMQPLVVSNASSENCEEVVTKRGSV